MRQIPVALQMFTIRDEAQADYLGALRAVAEIGYAGVELAGLALSPQDIRKALDDLGLAAAGAHFGYDEIINKTDELIEAGLTVGARYITCAALPGEMRNAEGYRRAGEELSKAGEIYARHGLGVCYHNHNFEFTRFDGKYGYDILFESGDARYLKAQIDTYWVQRAGEDPAEYICRYSGRCPLVHIKDMADDANHSFAEVGNGILDFDAIFEACEAAGVEWYIVEQDEWYGRSAVECARTSFENLKEMGIA
ncbi:MAG: sugar phosphate isomerase/epimerase [Armatimonadota bacterium]|nr:sugar phosphate isomerase/epimerase [Armatimonadota bacterium]